MGSFMHIEAKKRNDVSYLPLFSQIAFFFFLKGATSKKCKDGLKRVSFSFHEAEKKQENALRTNGSIYPALPFGINAYLKVNVEWRKEATRLIAVDN
jgi:hypothetical protein